MSVKRLLRIKNDNVLNATRVVRPMQERLSLPAPFEPMREQLEQTLKPLPYPPAWRVAPAG